MDKFDRIYALHNLFTARRTALKIQDIQQRLECSRPTAYRLIELLRDQLNAPIVSDKDGGGFLYGRNTSAGPYELPGLWFSADELLALASFQRLLQSLEAVVDEDGGVFRGNLPRPH